MSESGFAFDPATLANLTSDGEMSTKLPAIPEGEYAATIKSVQGRSVTTKNGDVPVLDVRFSIMDAAAIEATGLEEPTSKMTVWLDLDEAGNLDLSTGKNVGLGRLRKACGQNDPGPWSPAMLEGQPVKVTVRNRPSEDGEDMYDEVKRVDEP